MTRTGAGTGQHHHWKKSWLEDTSTARRFSKTTLTPATRYTSKKTLPQEDNLAKKRPGKKTSQEDGNRFITKWPDAGFDESDEDESEGGTRIIDDWQCDQAWKWRWKALILLWLVAIDLEY
jgi:hypothetical protein